MEGLVVCACLKFPGQVICQPAETAIPGCRAGTLGFWVVVASPPPEGLKGNKTSRKGKEAVS